MNMKQWKLSLLLALSLLVIFIVGIIDFSSIIDPNIGGRGQSVPAFLLVLYDKFGKECVLSILIISIFLLLILSYFERKKNK